MRWSAPAAALLAVLEALTSGCASVPKPAAEGAASAPFALVTPQEFEQQSPTLGVQVVIDAPPDLKPLLEGNLDLVRLGRVARDDIDDTEWSRLIDATPAQVRDLLQTEGYFSPRVSLERAPGRAQGQRDTVHVEVEPGVRARVSKVTIEAEGELERGASAGEAHAKTAFEQLRHGWDLPAGSDFRNPSWSAAKASALARLRAAGYAAAVWSGTGADIDTETNQVRLFLVADSGPLFRLGELQVEGLVRQNVETVRNLLVVARGTPVTEALLLDFQERLQKAGLFESISVTLDPDPSQAAAARVTARLSEAPLQTYTIGVGISANTGPRASLENTWRRFFGLAATLHNKVEYGQLRKAWDGDITSHPAAGLYRNFVGGAVEQLVSDTDTVLSQHLRVGRTQDAQRIERQYFLQWERSLRHTDDGVINSKAIANSINAQGVWRDLDSILLPTRGYSFSGQAGVGVSRGSDAEPGVFGRLYGRLTGYLPLGRAWYGQARLEVGQVILRSNMVVPDPEQFRAGGDDSVRGYVYRSLGPLVDGEVSGGNALVTGSVELARPVLASMPSLWGAVFVDAGNAATSFATLRPDLGYGVGVRWRSPVGPLRVDYAFGREVHRARLSFSIGIAF